MYEFCLSIYIWVEFGISGYIYTHTHTSSTSWDITKVLTHKAVSVYTGQQCIRIPFAPHLLQFMIYVTFVYTIGSISGLVYIFQIANDFKTFLLFAISLLWMAFCFVLFSSSYSLWWLILCVNVMRLRMPK